MDQLEILEHGTDIISNRDTWLPRTYTHKVCASVGYDHERVLVRACEHIHVCVCMYARVRACVRTRACFWDRSCAQLKKLHFVHERYIMRHDIILYLMKTCANSVIFIFRKNHTAIIKAR